MNARQARFVAAYLVDLNATEAALKAGYSKKTAAAMGWENLQKPEIKAAIEAKTAKQLEKVGLSAEKTKEFIRRVIDADVRILFDVDGNVLPIHKLTDEGAALIAGFEVVKRNLTAGDGQVDTIIKVKLKDQSRYVEMAAKHFGLLIERFEHSGEVVYKWKDTE